MSRGLCIRCGSTFSTTNPHWGLDGWFISDSAIDAIQARAGREDFDLYDEIRKASEVPIEVCESCQEALRVPQPDGENRPNYIREALRELQWLGTVLKRDPMLHPSFDALQKWYDDRVAPKLHAAGITEPLPESKAQSATKAVDGERYLAVFRHTKEGLEIGGPALFTDKPNVNGFVYPREVIEKALKSADPTKVMVVRPGNEAQVHMGSVQGVVTDLQLDRDGALFVKALILPGEVAMINTILSSLPASNDGVTKAFGLGMTTESVTDHLADPPRIKETEFRSVTIYRAEDFQPKNAL